MRKMWFSALLAGASAAFLIAAAPSALAVGTWWQSYERHTSSEACSAPTWQTAWQDSFSGQREWTPSWAMWPNSGRGGWVCNRVIVWTNGAGGSSSSGVTGCYALSISLSAYFQFTNGGLAQGTTGFINSGCTVPNVNYVANPNYVYATNSGDALALCVARFNGSAVSAATGDPEPNIYRCT